MAKYPSSPHSIFLPPGPVHIIRHSLRDHCAVSLTLENEKPSKSLRLSHAQDWWSPEEHTQPHRNSLPGRRNPKPLLPHELQAHPCRVPQAPDASDAEPHIALQFVAHVPADIRGMPLDGPPPPPPPTFLQPPKADNTHVQGIIPGLWVVFGQAFDRR